MSTTTEEIYDVSATEMANWLMVAKADAMKETVKNARTGCKQGEAFKNREAKLARKDGLLIRCPETGKIIRGHVKYSVIVEAEKVADVEISTED